MPIPLSYASFCCLSLYIYIDTYSYARNMLRQPILNFLKGKKEDSDKLNPDRKKVQGFSRTEKIRYVGR